MHDVNKWKVDTQLFKESETYLPQPPLLLPSIAREADPPQPVLSCVATPSFAMFTLPLSDKFYKCSVNLPWIFQFHRAFVLLLLLTPISYWYEPGLELFQTMFS